jgi:hypothetical protein
MPAIRSLHLPSSSICLLPERTIECLSFPCLLSKFATQPSQPQHLEDAVAAMSLTLSPEELAALEEPYVPHALAGFV